MKKILQINSSVQGENSFSTQLSNAILYKLQKKFTGSTIISRDVSKSFVPHLELKDVIAAYTPIAYRTHELKQTLQYSDSLIKELKDADIIIIAVAMYNFTIPSNLKAWIDQVVRVGETFDFTPTGAVGHVKNKKVYLAISSGGIYSVGDSKKNDFTEPYLRSILGFIGLNDITVFRVEGVVIPGLKETALQKAIDSISVEEFLPTEMENL